MTLIQFLIIGVVCYVSLVYITFIVFFGLIYWSRKDMTDDDLLNEYWQKDLQ
jgi:hypothetical protein